MIDTIVKIGVPFAVFIFGLIFTAIGYMFKKSVIEKLEQLTNKIEGMDSKIVNAEKEMLKEYVRKDDFEKNDEAHKNLWIEVRDNQRKIAKLETKLGMNDE